MADALVSVLNKDGYQPIFLPRTGLVPPDVMLYRRENRRIVRYGALASLASAAGKLKLHPSNVAPFEGRNTSGKDAAASLGLLGRVLQAIGLGAVPKVDIGFASNQELVFAFHGVSSLGVTLLELRKILATVKLEGLPADRVDAGDAHIAYDYLYARQLVIKRADGQEFDLGVKGKVEEFFDVAAKGKVKQTSRLSITCEADGDNLPAFAYRAARLLRREDGGFDVLGEQTRLAEGAAPAPYVPQRGVVLDVEETTAA
jgi:hypothetical protein